MNDTSYIKIHLSTQQFVKICLFCSQGEIDLFNHSNWQVISVWFPFYSALRHIWVTVIKKNVGGSPL